MTDKLICPDCKEAAARVCEECRVLLTEHDPVLVAKETAKSLAQQIRALPEKAGTQQFLCVAREAHTWECSVQCRQCADQQKNAAGQAQDAGVNDHTSAPVPAAPNAAPGNGGTDAAPMPEEPIVYEAADLAYQAWKPQGCVMRKDYYELRAYARSEHARADLYEGQYHLMREHRDNLERRVAELEAEKRKWVNPTGEGGANAADE